MRLTYLLFLFALSSCSIGKPYLHLTKVSYNELPGWQEDSQKEAISALRKSCNKLQKQRENDLSDWKHVCKNIKSYNNARLFFEEQFTPFAVTGAPTLFTGYFEQELEGSYTKHDNYIYPVYSTPNDLKTGEKYYTREQIDKGAIESRGLEIAWVNDPVQLFFLHVQGSGRIAMDDGTTLRIGFAAKNNQPYKSIGKYLVSIGAIDIKTASKSSIENWFAKNPEMLTHVLHQNPSYIFFKTIKQEGPIGGQGVPLTPTRSVAIDKSLIKYGTPIWIDTSLGARDSNKPLRKLMIAQDTGSAIKGARRIDIFFGHGKMAEKMAGDQNSLGRYFILLPK